MIALSIVGRCPECGAPLAARETCTDLFNRMLALEWSVIGEMGADIPSGEFLSTGAGVEGLRAHFLAVGSYQLQHPDRLEPAVVLGLRDSIVEVLAGRASIADVRLRARRAFNGPQRVWRRDMNGRDPALGPWPERWAMTVADCSDIEPGDYIATVRRWAETATAAIRAVRTRG